MLVLFIFVPASSPKLSVNIVHSAVGIVLMAQNPVMYVKIGLTDTEKEKMLVRPAQTGQKITEGATPANYVKTQK